MSFSLNVKEEIAKSPNAGDCCVHAMAYGMLLFAREFGSSGISIMTDHQCVAEKYAELIKVTTGVEAVTKISKAGKYTVSVNKTDIPRVLSEFSVSKNEAFSRINRGNLANESGGDGESFNCCNYAFFKGAFLSCGTISDPNKSYHLEFVAPHRMLSLDILKMLTETGLKAKHMIRRYVNVIYIKDSESIEDLLNIMGATISAFDIMNIKIYKNIRNVSNRRTNFDDANTTRTAAAACEQLDAIRKLKESGSFELLDIELREIAEAREENPDSSLRELGEMFSPALTRSAVNHRLKKIVDAANALNKENNS